MNDKPNRVLVCLCQAAVVLLICWFYCQTSKGADRHGPARVSAAATPEDSLVQPGDVLELDVHEDASFNGCYAVRRGGYIIVPGLGRVSVAGKTVEDAEAEVSKALESIQLQHAGVKIQRLGNGAMNAGPVVVLSGEFKNPGPFTLAAGTKPTLLNLILSCGGISDKADLTRVKVTHWSGKDSVIKEVNVQKILEGSGLEPDIPIGNGDVIMVPAGAVRAGVRAQPAASRGGGR
jgi:protein involved in polysaccharide export with SLBB domain